MNQKLYNVLCRAGLVTALTMMVCSGLFCQPKFSLTSGAFRNGGAISAKYTCDGDDLSPPLSWEGFPEGTESFVLVCTDPDAPAGTWVHWVVYDIPIGTVRLEEGASVLGMERLSWGVQGRTTFGNVGYGGPCPPPGKVHRYFFKMYALDIPRVMFREVVVMPVDRIDLEEAIEPHVLGVAELMGTYIK